MKQQLRLAETYRRSSGSIAPDGGQLRTARPGDNEVVVRPTGRAAGAGRLLRVHPTARRGVRPLETDAAGRHFPRRTASGEQSEGDAQCCPCSPKRNPHRLSRLPMGPLRCHVCILALQEGYLKSPVFPCTRIPLPVASSDSPGAEGVMFVSLQCDGDTRVTHASWNARFPR